MGLCLGSLLFHRLVSPCVAETVFSDLRVHFLLGTPCYHIFIPAFLVIEWAHVTEFYGGCRQKLRASFPPWPPSFPGDPHSPSHLLSVSGATGPSGVLWVYNQWQSLGRSLGLWPSAWSSSQPITMYLSLLICHQAALDFLFLLSLYLNQFRQLRHEGNRLKTFILRILPLWERSHPSTKGKTGNSAFWSWLHGGYKLCHWQNRFRI